MPTVSRAKELADAEAARAEAENPDEDEWGEGEAEPIAGTEPEGEEEEEGEAGEPAEAEPTEPTQAVAALTIGPDDIRKAERARETYRKKIGDILGAEAVAHECVLCAGLGYLADLPPLGTEFTFEQGEGGPELSFRQPPATPDYRQASDKTTCPECDGFGHTLTGAKKPAQEVWQCAKCGGAGWIGVGPQGTAPVSLDFQPHTEPAQGNGGDAGVGIDAWGRPAGHQHWGVPPAMIQG